jgi:hypothetical protein
MNASCEQAVSLIWQVTRVDHCPSHASLMHALTQQGLRSIDSQQAIGHTLRQLYNVHELPSGYLASIWHGV